MALTQTFNRKCTNYYYYSNTFTCNNRSCNQYNAPVYTNSGYSDHTDYDDYYTECSDSGCSNQTHTETYYSDGCPQSPGCNDYSEGYNDHSESNPTWPDHYDSGYSNHHYDYSDYTNYQNGYYCSTYANYTNYIDASNTKLGGPITLTWSSIDKDAPVNSMIMKEIRDNVKKLSTEKQRNQVSTTNVSSDSGTASNSVLGTYEEVKLSSVNGIRDTLNNLYSELNQNNSNNPSFNFLQSSTISSLKTAIDTLASTDISSSYVNYVDSNYDYNNQNTYSNSSNIPVGNITYYGNTSSYVNSYCSEYKNS